MVLFKMVVKFSSQDWLDKICPRMMEDGSYLTGSHNMVWLRWNGPFEREGTAHFNSDADAMWFILKYMGE